MTPTTGMNSQILLLLTLRPIQVGGVCSAPQHKADLKGGACNPVFLVNLLLPWHRKFSENAGPTPIGLTAWVERCAAALAELGIPIVLGEATAWAGPLYRVAAFYQLLDQLPHLPRDQGYARQDHQHCQQPAQLRSGGEIPKPHRGHGNDGKVESIQKGGKNTRIHWMFYLIDQPRVDENNGKEGKLPDTRATRRVRALSQSLADPEDS